MRAEDDITLLQEYAATGAESAFATLVSRHINFVHSAALRQVRDRHLAEEVAQVVFIILARKAGSISPKVVLSGWLFKTVRYTASAQVKAAIRRQRREEEAYMNSVTSEEMPDHTWERMSPMLDEALADLNEKDRQAVLLRYFENRSLAQVGGALAVNEDTAGKRVSRALEKLRQFFARRGVVLSVVAIGGALSGQAVQAAPVGLAATISTTAVKGSAVAASTLTLLKGALKLMTWAKIKAAAAVGTVAIVVAATGVAIERIAVQTTGATAVADSSVTQPDPPATDAIVTVNTTQAAGATPGVPRKRPAQRAAESSEIDDSVWSQLDSRAFSTLPPAFILRPTHFEGQSAGVVSYKGSKDGEKVLARAISFGRLIGVAYGVPSSRVLFPEGMPEEKVDVLMTVPGGSKEMLQEEIRKQFGLAAAPEMHEGDVLAVRVKDTQAPGLKPSQLQDSTTSGGGGGFGGGSSSSKSSAQVLVRTGEQGINAGSGTVRSTSRNTLQQYTAQNQSIENLIRNLQSHFEATLYDETGLTGSYDISLKWEPSSDNASASEAIKAAMVQQLGLEVTPGRAQIEMLVVRKAE